VKVVLSGRLATVMPSPENGIGMESAYERFAFVFDDFPSVERERKKPITCFLLNCVCMIRV
jgi:hypothetical protein